MRSTLGTAELGRKYRPLRLRWSEAVSGTELYEGENVETFSTGWHLHEGWQFVAVTQGQRLYEFKSGTIVAKPGSLLLLPPRLIHRAHCLEHGTNNFKIATLPDLRLNSAHLAIPVELRHAGFFDAFLSTYGALQEDRTREHEASLLSGLNRILAAAGQTRAQACSRPPSYIAESESYLLRTLDKVPSLDSLAFRAGVSRFHFAHIFSKHVGLSPLAFHARVRLLRSRKIISEGCSLSETAHRLGFADQSHFGRLFKKVYAMTPRQYQQRIAS